MLSSETNEYTSTGFDRKPFEFETTLANVPFLQISILNADAVKLTWTPVGNAKGYKVIRDGYAIDAGNVTTYAIGSLPLETAFRFSVEPYDSNDNPLPASNQILINPTTGIINQAIAPKVGKRIIVRTNQTATANGLPLPQSSGLPTGTATGATTGTTTATGTAAQPATDDEKLFGYDKSTVLIVGGLAVGGIALYMFSGK